MRSQACLFLLPLLELRLESSWLTLRSAAEGPDVCLEMGLGTALGQGSRQVKQLLFPFIPNRPLQWLLTHNYNLETAGCHSLQYQLVKDFRWNLSNRINISNTEEIRKKFLSQQQMPG